MEFDRCFTLGIAERVVAAHQAALPLARHDAAVEALFLWEA